MNNSIRISAKTLGELSLPNFCPRCFWLKAKLGHKPPYSIFPGIFSSIDAYTKNVVHNWFDTKKCCPSWLNELGDVVGYKKAPHYSTFFAYDPDSGITLTGTPDDIFILSDGSHAIIDYKTAKYTGTQDSLLPMYVTQLNSYALIAQTTGINPVSKLALVYMEPQSLPNIEHENNHHRNDGFNMVFSAKILEIPYITESISLLLQQAKEILISEVAPKGRAGCEDCIKVDYIAKTVE